MSMTPKEALESTIAQAPVGMVYIADEIGARLETADAKAFRDGFLLGACYAHFDAEQAAKSKEAQPE